MPASLRPAHVWPQKLSVLLAGLPVMAVGQDPVITGVSLDSREVHPGDLYVALPGIHTHGAQYAAGAIDSGACAILTDPAGKKIIVDHAGSFDLPIAVCADPRWVMAEVSARCYGHPAWAMRTFGVTGTNGKTSTVALLAAGLRSAEVSVGTIGTLGFDVDDEALEISRSTVTTPESCDLQAILRVMVERGAESLAMEVSSHALALHRVTGMVFDVVGFTNLGQDHLDFHATIEDYFKAKARLFTARHARRAVINADDERAPQLITQAITEGLQVRTVGFLDEADYRIASWHPQRMGSTFTLEYEHQVIDVSLSLPGEYNVRNAAMAVAMLLEAGFEPEQILPGIASATIPGRMEPVDLGESAPRVFVDFAHTPQAIQSSLATLNHPDFADSRVIAVFGAGGDRDPLKRALMGQVAAQESDVVIVTEDNPRAEDPAQIRQAVADGARAAVAAADPESRLARVEVIDQPGRSDAIRRALEIAGPHDAIAILGKGHEKTQEINHQLFDFDDVAVVTEQWADLHPDVGSQQEDR